MPSPPVNPQWKLIENKLKRKERKKSKSERKKVSKETNDDQIGEHQPSQNLCDLKEDVLKKKILSALCREAVDDNSETGSLTARDLSENMPQQPSDRLTKLNDYADRVTQLKRQFDKKQKETTDWITKYRKRVIDMQMDVREFEKKLRKTLNKEPNKLEALLALVEKNKLKRQLINEKLAKTKLEHPEKTVIRVVIELVFNCLQSTLWTLAMIRDFFAKP